MSVLEKPTVINHIDNLTSNNSFRFATGNQNKLQEIARLLGVPEVPGIDLKIDEIQSLDPLEVAGKKAISAYEKNGGEPILVEDTSLDFLAFNGLPGTFVNQFTSSAEIRKQWCKNAQENGDRRAVARVIFALFDGTDIHYRIGETSGTIANELRGTQGFGWDDMFEPDGQDQLDDWDGKKRTFAEMSPEQKDKLSMRTRALLALRDKPIQVKTGVYQLPEPYQFQIDAIDHERLNNETALQHAFNLESIRGNKPNKELKVDQFPPYYCNEFANGSIQQIIPGKDSPSLGFIVTPIDTARKLYGQPHRLRCDPKGKNIVWWQQGPDSIKKALASRTFEFNLHHNDETYSHLRDLKDGYYRINGEKIPLESRPNTPSPVIEKLISILYKMPETADPEEAIDDAMSQYQVIDTAAVSELGYARESSDNMMSRTRSANLGLFLRSTGIPSSIFSLGGMPPVSGWKDVITTSALSFMRSYITRNSIFAGNDNRQERLFISAKEDIQMLGLPKDIEDLVIAQIGISVGCENPKLIANYVRHMYEKEGLRSARIYTTNADPKIVQTAEAIRQTVGVGPEEFHLCVAPFVDIKQAKKLISPNIRTNTLLAGHGAGENCTSLAAGGAANALELLYLMYLDPDFNNTAIGLEGGTGTSIGALLGMVDVISMNRRGVQGGIETGGLYAEHINGFAAQPYHGSASPVTQWIEALMYPELNDRRVDDAGRLKNVEGKPNYMKKPRSVDSITDNFAEARMYGGRALADQDARHIYELRKHIKQTGHKNHRIVSNAAAYLASPHRQ